MTFLPRKKIKGFTLVELLVVVMIIGILASVGVAFMGNAQKNSRDSRKKADIEAIARAYEANYDPGNGGYQVLQPSNFTNGAIPVPPEGGKYTGFLSSAQVGFKVCTALNDGSQYCRTSAQGNVACPYDSLATGLVGYWKMNDGSGMTVANAGSGGTSLNGSLASINPAYYSWSSSCVNSSGCLNFNVSASGNGSVPINDSGYRLPYGNNSKTLCLWASANVVDAYNKTAFFYGNPSSLAAFYIGRGGSYLIAGSYADSFPSVANFWRVNEWNNLCLVYDSSIKKLSLYANGNQSPVSQVNVPYLNTASSPIGIAGTAASAAYGLSYWNGSIDDVRFYNRALSATEVSAVYNEKACNP